MKDVYLTSTLKKDWNLAFNARVCAELEKRGFCLHLPQRDTNQGGTYEEIYRVNIAGIRNSRVVLCVAENESVNWGVEAGFAFGLGMPVLALAQEGHFIPVMSRGMFAETLVVPSLDDLPAYIDSLVSALKRALG
jgi:nucleoside 2-deoxyribosyltransferase